MSAKYKDDTILLFFNFPANEKLDLVSQKYSTE